LAFIDLKGVQMSFKIGIIADSFRLSPREGIAKAKELGADGVQVYAVEGEVCAENMDAEARKDFREYVASQGLAISALCGDLGGHGFQLTDENVDKVKRSKAIVDLAVDLGTNVVTTHIGVVPEDKKSEIYKNMLSACRELGEYAAHKGVTFAIETGPEKADTLKSFLDEVGSKGIGVNLDPANLVMVVGDDPVRAVSVLAPYIVHTHAKDGVQHQPCDAVEVYGAFADGGFGELEKKMGKLFSEVPLGEGSVDWDNYLAALESSGFDGFLTIEREVGQNPADDIGEAVRFLRGKI
jgi:sugar phosphate isomerase/epimerase